MARLILLRHAKSDYPLGVPDHERPLSARGRANADTMANLVLGAIPPGWSLGAAVSTATRTQETWARIEAGIPAVAQHWNDAALYLAEPATIAETAACFTTDVGIIVGHNPGIWELAESIPAAREQIAEEMAHKFPTAAFAVIDTGTTPLAHWQPEDATCIDFVKCR